MCVFMYIYDARRTRMDGNMDGNMDGFQDDDVETASAGIDLFASLSGDVCGASAVVSVGFGAGIGIVLHGDDD